MDNEKSIQPVNLQLIQTNYEEDEISLYDIWQILVEYKFYIASITCICTLVALIYAIQATPVYEAKAYLLPPEQKDLEGINIRETKYSPLGIYQNYIRKLRSISIRRKFFEENNLVSQLVGNDDADMNSDNVFNNEFNNKLHIEIIHVDKRKIEDHDPIKISFTSMDAKLTAELVNKFISYVEKETIKLIKDDIKASIEFNIFKIEREISRKRGLTREQRLDQIKVLLEEENIKRDDIKNKIATLKKKAQIELEDRKEVFNEAIAIAKELGIDNPTLLSAASDENTLDVMINTQQTPEYMRGVKALNAEIEILKERKDNEDAFISGLRDLERELEMLNENPKINSLKNRENDDPYIPDLLTMQYEVARLLNFVKLIDMETRIKSVKVDEFAKVPKDRIKPNRRKIVMFGMFAGLIAGFGLAFIVNFIKKSSNQVK